MKKIYRTPKSSAVIIQAEQMIAESQFETIDFGGPDKDAGAKRRFSSDDYAHDEL